MINTIILGHALNTLPQLPAESVSCVTCSPPYWGLRDYGIEPIIWDEKECEHKFSIASRRPIRHKPGETNPGKEAWYKDKGGIGNSNIRCEHKFNEYDSKLLHENRQNLDGGTLGNPKYRKNLHGSGNAKAGFCSKCNAWRGSLGLEPTFELYIKHLCDIFDEVKRVLRKDGTCWVNLRDSYAGGKGQSGARDANSQDERFKKGESLEHGYHQASGGYGKTRPADGKIGIPAKSLCLIPQRFVIEMVDRGWILRNTIIWHKKNCMPSSAKDRFTVDFEDVFFFTKSNKALFWTNEKTLECVGKQPLGIKGIEGKDWEWRTCPNCQGEGTTIGKALKDGAAPIVIGPGIVTKNTKAFKVCHRCKGSGKIKYSFWTGHDYWFEQQFEEYAPDTLPRMDRGVNINKWTLGADGQTPHNLSQPRLSKKRGYKIKQQDKEAQHPQYHGKDINYGKQGRNKRTVWAIPTKSFPEAHFAVYPETLIEPMIKAGCPRYICKKCGKARVKIYRTKIDINKVPKKWRKTYRGKVELNGSPTKRSVSELYAESLAKEKTVVGYSDCGCNAGWESGVNLDPFIGSGTSALVALKQRKRFIGIEIKQEYIDMSNRRIANVQQKIF